MDAGLGDEHVGHGPQDLVAGRVTVLGADRTEAVDVQHGDGEGPGVAPRAGGLDVELVAEAVQRAQAGDRVALAASAQLGLELVDARPRLREQLFELLILLALAASKHDSGDIGNLREKLVSAGTTLRRHPEGRGECRRDDRPRDRPRHGEHRLRRRRPPGRPTARPRRRRDRHAGGPGPGTAPGRHPRAGRRSARGAPSRRPRARGAVLRRQRQDGVRRRPRAGRRHARRRRARRGLPRLHAPAGQGRGLRLRPRRQGPGAEDGRRAARAARAAAARPRRRRPRRRHLRPQPRARRDGDRRDDRARPRRRRRPPPRPRRGRLRRRRLPPRRLGRDAQARSRRGQAGRAARASRRARRPARALRIPLGGGARPLPDAARRAGGRAQGRARRPLRRAAPRADLGDRGGRRRALPGGPGHRQADGRADHRRAAREGGRRARRAPPSRSRGETIRACSPATGWSASGSRSRRPRSCSRPRPTDCPPKTSSPVP